MGNRPTRLYTRTGDQGATALADGCRVPKEDARIEALGCLDELNCHLGLLAACEETRAIADLGEKLRQIQYQLFDLGAELARPGSMRLDAQAVTCLEAALDACQATLPPLREFILPGGGVAAAQCHLARAVCRRAERRLFRLSRQTPVNAHSLAYLNRLSDWLFVYARLLARQAEGEIRWPGLPRI